MKIEDGSSLSRRDFLKLFGAGLAAVVISPTLEALAKAELDASKFTYFSQKDPKWQDIPAKGRASVYYQGCGIITGAMVTGTDPHVYWKMFADHFKAKVSELHPKGEERILTVNGTSFFDHKEVLEASGYKFKPVQGHFKEIKAQLTDYSSKGIPVWVNAAFWTGYKWIKHHSMAVGVDAESRFVFNDPWFGEAHASADKDISADLGKNDSWKVYAVVAPGDVNSSKH